MSILDIAVEFCKNIEGTKLEIDLCDNPHDSAVWITIAPQVRVRVRPFAKGAYTTWMSFNSSTEFYTNTLHLFFFKYVKTIEDAKTFIDGVQIFSTTLRCLFKDFFYCKPEDLIIEFKGEMAFVYDQEKRVGIADAKIVRKACGGYRSLFTIVPEIGTKELYGVIFPSADDLQKNKATKWLNELSNSSGCIRIQPSEHEFEKVTKFFSALNFECTRDGFDLEIKF